MSHVLKRNANEYSVLKAKAKAKAKDKVKDSCPVFKDQGKGQHSCY